jgi:hypothetical protein
VKKVILIFSLMFLVCPCFSQEIASSAIYQNELLQNDDFYKEALEWVKEKSKNNDQLFEAIRKTFQGNRKVEYKPFNPDDYHYEIDLPYVEIEVKNKPTRADLLRQNYENYLKKTAKSRNKANKARAKVWEDLSKKIRGYKLPNTIIRRKGYTTSGNKYQIQTGPRGGKYHYSESGKKVYH